MATTSDLHKGMVIRHRGEKWRVVDWQHHAPGNWRAMVIIKMKNLNNGKVIEERFSAGEKIEDVHMEYHDAEYLYHDGDTYHFMEKESFEQVEVPQDMVQDILPFLRENDAVMLVYADGELSSVDLPTFVTLRVASTITAVRGDTATNVEKPATLETGAEITVPAFVKEGDLIRLDTRTGKYLERVKE